MIAVTVRCAQTGKVIDQFTMGDCTRVEKNNAIAKSKSRNEVVAYLEHKYDDWFSAEDVGAIDCGFDPLSGSHIVRLFITKKKTANKRGRE